jgi:hypothetical protein
MRCSLCGVLVRTMYLGRRRKGRKRSSSSGLMDRKAPKPGRHAIAPEKTSVSSPRQQQQQQQQHHHNSRYHDIITTAIAIAIAIAAVAILGLPPSHHTLSAHPRLRCVRILAPSSVGH